MILPANSRLRSFALVLCLAVLVPLVPSLAQEVSVAVPTEMEMAHEHLLLEVDASLPTPSLTHLVFPDAVDGYNIQILTQNFEFTPSAINRQVEANSGHAHLYVNGVKYARIYSNWFHLPSAALQPGVNLVSVTLNANDHSEWAVAGEAIASSVRVIRPEN